MTALLTIVLACSAAVAACALAAASIWRRRVIHAFDVAYDAVPRDEGTGLLGRQTCLARIQAELKRADRTRGTVWVATVTVAVGESERFGRLVNDALRYPEVGFRLADAVICIVRPGLDEARRVDLLARLVTAAPREQLVVGEATWRAGEPIDAAALLTRAAAADGGGTQ